MALNFSRRPHLSGISASWPVSGPLVARLVSDWINTHRQISIFFSFPFLSNESMSKHFSFVIFMFVQVWVIPLADHWRPVRS